MDNHSYKEAPILIGTAGGTLASTLPNIGAEHILTTCILGLVGATVSFIMSLLLKKLMVILGRLRLPKRKKRKK